MALIRSGALALALVLGPAHGEGILAGQATVVDADTVRVQGRLVHLEHIDALELVQRCRVSGRDWRCGASARRALARHLAGRVTRCVTRRAPGTRGVVGACTVDDESIAQWLVENGWALVRQGAARALRRDEERARTAGRGMWRSEFVVPWRWRRGRRLPWIEPPPQRGTLGSGSPDG